MINNKYTYKEYPRETNESGDRNYFIDNEALPSVTTILAHTKSKETSDALTQWRSNIGDDEADRIVAEAVKIGNQIHLNLEQYILHQELPTGTILEKMMSNTIIKKGLININEVWAVEASLYSKGLYAGTADLIGVHKNQPMIGDFKNSRKRKTIDDIEDYRCQLAAYSIAHNEMFGTKINKGVIFMITRDCEYLEFEIVGKLYDDSVDMWLRRLEMYYEQNN